MRLDQYLSAIGLVSRRNAKQLLKSDFFQLNNTPISDGKTSVHTGDILTREHETHVVRTTVTVLIHKPAGYISADRDEHGWPSYQRLLDDCPYHRMLHIAGRLDVDTTWLIIASSDGQLIHRIISPRSHLPKTYLVTTRDPLETQMIERLTVGVWLDDGYQTLPAVARQLDEHHLELTLIEGKFHQVKRMLMAVDNEVTDLVRTQIGPRTLAGLPSGGWRILDNEEVALALQKKISTTSPSDLSHADVA